MWKSQSLYRLEDKVIESNFTSNNYVFWIKENATADVQQQDMGLGLYPSAEREGYTLKTQESLLLFTMLDPTDVKDTPLLGRPSTSAAWSTIILLHVTAESTPDLSTIPDDNAFGFDTSTTPCLSLCHQAVFSPDLSVMADDDPPHFCLLYF